MAIYNFFFFNKKEFLSFLKVGRQRGTSKVITSCPPQFPLWLQLDMVPFFVSHPKLVCTAALCIKQLPGPLQAAASWGCVKWVWLISLAPRHLRSRVYDTFQCTGRNDMLSAQDLLLTTFISTIDWHFMEKIKFSEAEWKNGLKFCHESKHLNRSR